LSVKGGIPATERKKEGGGGAGPGNREKRDGGRGKKGGREGVISQHPEKEHRCSFRKKREKATSYPRERKKKEKGGGRLPSAKTSNAQDHRKGRKGKGRRRAKSTAQSWGGEGRIFIRVRDKERKEGKREEFGSAKQTRQKGEKGGKLNPGENPFSTFSGEGEKRRLREKSTFV